MLFIHVSVMYKIFGKHCIKSCYERDKYKIYNSVIPLQRPNFASERRWALAGINSLASVIVSTTGQIYVSEATSMRHAPLRCVYQKDAAGPCQPS